MLVERYHENKVVYDFIKKYDVIKVTVTIGEYEEDVFDVNINIWYWDKYKNASFESFTPSTWNKLSKAEQIAKGIFNQIEKYTSKVKYEGLENC